MRPQALKQMPLRRYLAAMILAICTFSATGCDNWSFRFKGPSIELPGFSYNSNKLNPLQISGEEKWHSGDFQGAREDFDKLIKEEPNNAYAFFSRGSALLKLGKLQEAMDDTNKALELNPNIAKAYETRGVAKELMGNQGGAIRDFNRAIETDGNFSSAYANRGAVKSDLGNYEGALIDLNKALEIDPNLAYGYRLRAKNYDRQGNMTDACKDMKKGSSLGDEEAARLLKDNPGSCK